MALTITIDKTENTGSIMMTRGTIAFDSSYPTNGESLTANDLGLNTLDVVMISPNTATVFEYDYTNSKVKAYRGALAEVSNGTDLSAMTAVKFVAFGRL